MSISNRDEVQRLFEYPLFEALAHVRSRRFPVGCSQKAETLRYESCSQTVSLSNLEEAILCWAATGINGTVLSDITPDVLGNPFLTLVGRTHGSACNMESTKLFFTNDNGVFLYDPKQASKPVEIENEQDRDRILEYFDQDTLRISYERLDPTPAGLNPVNRWNCNAAGTTLFIPVVDMTETYLGFLMASIHFERLRMLDDRTGKPAGVGRWIDNGTLIGPKYTISMLENYAFTSSIAAAYMMAQNIRLAAEAMGLGCFPFNAYVPLVVMGGTPRGKGLGFRFIAGKDGGPVPLGIDGIAESYCPPYFRNMDAAIDAFLDKKFGPGSVTAPDYQGRVVGVKDETWARLRTAYPKYSEDSIEAAKAYCSYIFDTYGRFPARYDNKTMPVWIQAHHLEMGFYDKYFQQELVNDTHRRHMDIWHK